MTPLLHRFPPSSSAVKPRSTQNFDVLYADQCFRPDSRPPAPTHGTDSNVNITVLDGSDLPLCDARQLGRHV